jgi:hypothetical protein
MTSSFPGVMFGPLHYRSLEMDKTNAFKQKVKWWITSLPEAYNPISHGEIEVTMSTDKHVKTSLTAASCCSGCNNVLCPLLHPSTRHLKCILGHFLLHNGLHSDT